MYENTEPSLIEPSDDAILWRYLSLRKLRSLIEDRSLFFCQLDKLVDTREGSLPQGTANHIRKSLSTPDKEEKIGSFEDVNRLVIAVNCWHIHEYENSLMWDAYAKQGVAIRTTFASLRNSLDMAFSHVQGGMVRYIDHDKDEENRAQSLERGSQWSAIEMATLKHPSFEGEKEFRLITNLLDDVTIMNESTGEITKPIRIENGIFVNVNLYRMMHEVILSPHCDDESERAVLSLMQSRSTLAEIPVSRSTLYH
ncbi:MAG: DUF2971 domain-containing protein [Chloroflexi bacterium]|nr:DUF2971 domain-containing protein [Chloroflexota bacterium]